MSSVNKAFVLGRLGKDVEVRSFQNGGRVASFSVATSERWKDKQTGEQKERVQWHNVSVFNENLVSVAERFLKKGSQVAIEGAMETRRWTDKDGNEKYTTEIVLRPFRGEITLLDSKPNPGEALHEAPKAHSAAPMASGDYLSDEIPF